MTDKTSTATARRHLGELGAMSEQTQRVERQIMARGEELLAAAEKSIAEHRAAALAGDAEADKAYRRAVLERGRLQQVISRSRLLLA